MGESIAEATILKWHKKVGDAVEKDQTILEISTDKVDSEIPSPASGVIVEFRAKEGDTVPVKSVIAIIETDKAQAKAGGEKPQAEAPKKAEAPKPQPKEAQEQQAKEKSAPAQPQAYAPPPPTQMQASSYAEAQAGHVSEMPGHVGEKFFSPLVRNLGAQHGLSPVELASIPGTGAHGRVTKSDVLSYLQYRDHGGGRRSAKTNGTSSGMNLPPPAPRPEYGPDGQRVEVMDNMRKRIAEHMVRSKATSAHVYSTAEVDAHRLVLFRSQHQEQFLAREGFKLSFTPFFLEAAVKALIQFPYVNSSVDGDKVILKKSINLGCAVALGNTGLIVPVIKNADQLSFVGLASALNSLAAKARSKSLTPDDVQGGTFTVTNPGVFGNIIGNPIINQPQVAILSIGAIKKRPVVVDDMIGIREMVYLTLSYDHRIIDGSLGGQFLQYVTQYLENWDLDRGLY